MTYTQLLDGMQYTGAPPVGTPTLVTQDNRKVIPGAVFVCVVGRSADGHKYARQAVDAGAGMVITQRPLGLPGEIQVKNTRHAFATLCANYFGRPAERLTLVAVTGTNGKTTVTSVLRQMLTAQGVSCGLIGTIHSQIGPVEIPAKFTTPEAWDLNALLAQMVAAGCTHAVMEASSQALDQGRLHGVRFALGVFTNLTRDHLDYHGDMESYFNAKKALFAQCDAMLVNADDAYGQRLLAEADCPCKQSYGLAPHAGYTATDIHYAPGGVGFTYGGEKQGVEFPMPGEFSVYNALAAIGAARMLGFEEPQVLRGLAACTGVPGRSQVLYSGAFTVIRDFAHTADAVEKLLCSLRPFVAGRMVVLFGCAGQRDPDKRPLMSASAMKYGDLVCMTADNPRAEPLEQIFADAMPPLKSGGKPYIVEPDREKAVREMLDTLAPGDMLVLCGKGHEDYQVMDGYTLYQSEKDIVEDWAAQRGLA